MASGRSGAAHRDVSATGVDILYVSGLGVASSPLVYKDSCRVAKLTLPVC